MTSPGSKAYRNHPAAVFEMAVAESIAQLHTLRQKHWKAGFLLCALFLVFLIRMSGQSWYDAAQICANGHLMTAAANQNPERKRAFCPSCGAKTLTACPSCGGQIKGAHCSRVHNYVMDSWDTVVGGFKAIPAHCSECGMAFPWTSARLAAAKELAGEVEGLSDDERETLKDSLDDLTTDTPKTEVAASRVKRLIAKSGKVAADTLNKILVTLATEYAKKIIFPGS